MHLPTIMTPGQRGSIGSRNPVIGQNKRLTHTCIARSRQRSVVVRADRESGSFWSGFAIGGVVCGVLGFVFAPQISQALLGEEQRLRLPRFLDEDEDPEVTKQNLAEKIAQLNAAIDDVSSQLKSQDIAIEDAVETSSS